MRSSTPLTPLVLPRGESAMIFKTLSRVNLFNFFPQAGAVFGCFVTSLGPQLKQGVSQGCANISCGTSSCHLETPVDRLAGLYFSAVFLQYLSAKLLLCGNFLWRMLVCGAAFVFTSTQPTFLILFCSSCADQLDRIRFCEQVLYLNVFE